MKIETKYGLGAKLFYLNEDKKIKQESVSRVAAFVAEDDISVSYSMGDSIHDFSISEKHLFKTKEDLIASLDDVDEES